ncbi:flagellar motor switch protein FliM [Microbacterium aerolatum]|uniref:Flagellar motor switch protein FliM n=1 Tax=Microbacterium aerolatum TaxID=153731 RepID=A0A511AFI9_9MICO|nr:flagellar motor switch protein FliM [Microbacterium aerolatum]GEK86910.1 flagellar motor switch protein FliM [Microbacterium aerolatum]GGB15974.1 flagellar motor switch protein FliM [Microbacterium aerolatum]
MIEDSARSVVQAETPTGTSSPTADITVYDFERSATLSREHARALELAFETFSRQWSADLSAKIRGRATVSVEYVRMLTYGEYAQSLPTTTALVVCALPDSPERMIVQFPSSAATAWIVQMVGGRPTTTAEERTFTPIEQALIGALMRDAIDLLTKTMDGLLPQGISITGIQYNSQFAQVAAATEPVIVAQLAMRLGGRSVPTSVMLPASILSMFRNVAASDESASPELVRRQVEETPIELALRLSPRTMLPREVLGLSVGDLVPLPHAADRPLMLLAGDQPIATAAVGTSGARLACVVTTTVSDPASEESA